jgi:hypothetical protein
MNKKSTSSAFGSGIDAALRFLDKVPPPDDFMEDITTGMLEQSILSPGQKRSPSPFTHHQMQSRGTIDRTQKMQKNKKEGKFHGAKNEDFRGKGPRVGKKTSRLTRQISDTTIYDDGTDYSAVNRQNSDPSNNTTVEGSPRTNIGFKIFAQDFATECLLGEPVILSNPPSPGRSPRTQSSGPAQESIDEAELGRALFAWAADAAQDQRTSPLPPQLPANENSGSNSTRCVEVKSVIV